MDDNKQEIKKLINEGESFAKAGEWEKAMACYNAALDALVKQARAFADKSEPAVIDAVVGKGILSGQYLKKFNDYLKKDYTAATVSNAMGVVFARMGNLTSAKAFFEQAIDLTPPGEVYDDPHIGLEMLKNHG